MPAKSPVIVDLRFHPDQVREGLKTAFAGREVINRADAANEGRDLSGISYAVLWKPLDDLFRGRPISRCCFPAVRASITS